MRRRSFLAATGSALAAATAGCNAVGERLTGTDSEQTEGPVTVETLDAPGSTAGRATVPDEGRVTCVEFFATTCSVCASQMSVLGEAYARLDADVQFLSVTSEPVGLTVSRSEVASWWADHDGAWPVAVDDGTALSRRYDATSVPTVVVVDPDGTVAWSHTGRTTAARILDAIRSARAGGES